VARRHSLGETLRGMNLDTFGSLGFAFLINAALLILAASRFTPTDSPTWKIWPTRIGPLAPLLHSDLASVLFAVALLACGLNSTLTGTLAGQAVMEGFRPAHLAHVARPADARRRHRAGVGRRVGLWRTWIGQPARCQPGGTRPDAAAGRGTADHVWRRSQADGRLAGARRAVVAGGRVRRDHPVERRTAAALAAG
jgi:hypothetical protein